MPRTTVPTTNKNKTVKRQPKEIREEYIERQMIKNDLSEKTMTAIGSCGNLLTQETECRLTDEKGSLHFRQWLLAQIVLILRVEVIKLFTLNPGINTYP